MSRFVKHEINSPQMRSVVVLILCTYFWIYLRPPRCSNFTPFFLGGGQYKSIGGPGPTGGMGNSNTALHAGKCKPQIQILTVYGLWVTHLEARAISNPCGRCLYLVASNVHLTKMPSSSTSTGSQIAIWRRSLSWTRREFCFDLQSLLTGKIGLFVWLPAFLSEPSSARHSSAPSITTVWSNYQTSYNDFFEVYITETVTLSPNTQMVVLTSSTFSVLIVLRPHWSNRLQLIFRYDKSQ